MPGRLRAIAAAVLAASLAATEGSAVATPPLEPLVIRVDPAARPDAATVRDLPAALARVARDRAADDRAGRPRRPVTIALAPGLHRLLAPLRIGPDHGGTDGAPLLLRGAPGLAARIVGSVALSPLPSPVPPALLARVPAAARPHVRAYRLPAGVASRAPVVVPRRLGEPEIAPAFEVFDGAGALRPARWPNEGWARVAAADGHDPASFTASAGSGAGRWAGEEEAWAEGYWRWGWLHERIALAGAAADGRLRLAAPPYEGILPDARFRVVHALAELDVPGEWWRDARRGLLLAWPRTPDATLEVSVAEDLVRVEDARHMRIEGVALERSRGDLVRVEGGGDVVVARSRLAWAGRRGAVFEGADSSGLDGCDVLDTGSAGARLVGGDRGTLRPGGLFVRDGRFRRFARLAETQNPAIELDGVGAAVTGTSVTDTDAYAIHIRGNDHVVEGNEFAHLLGGSTDSGAVYAGRDWTARGTLIRRNLFRDIRAGPSLEIKGVYLDDMAGGFTIADNVFLRVDQPVFLGGGRDNVVSGNLFVRSSPAIHVDSRGETWARGAAEDPGSEIRAAFRAVPTGSPAWRARYPTLAGWLGDRPGVARGNRLLDNVVVEGEPFRFADEARADRQVVRGTAGPEGLSLPDGRDLAAAATRSVDPADFAGLRNGAGPLALPAARPLPRPPSAE